MFRVVIPARYGSSRLPAKALVRIAGRTMVQWVYEKARASGACQVLIATDDDRIAQVARGFGAEAIFTSAAHQSGTDRIAEVAEKLGWADDDDVVNVQGDEPLIPPALIDQVAAVLVADGPSADIATLCVPIGSLAEYLDPNAVKVVLDGHGRALYFSRAPIPWNRDGAAGGIGTQKSCDGAYRHIGLYAYRVGALKRLASLPPAPLELRERLEQLRALENGLIIAVNAACVAPGPDVNTPADLERVLGLVGSGEQSEKAVPPAT